MFADLEVVLMQKAEGYHLSRAMHSFNAAFLNVPYFYDSVILFSTAAAVEHAAWQVLGFGGDASV